MTETSDPPVSSRLARGALLMSVISVFMRASSLLAQLVLGRILLQEDFGLFAMALGFTNVAASLRSVLQPVLIDLLEHDTNGFERTYRTTMVSVWTLALLGASLAGFVAEILDEPDLRWLLVTLLLIMPFQIWPVFGLAALNHNLQFPTVGRVITAGVIARYGALVGTALLGVGPYCFAFATGSAMLTECFLLRKQISVSPGVLTKRTLNHLKRATDTIFGRLPRRWIWLSAIALSLTISGDYLAASTSPRLDTMTLGLYYFAYTLTGAFHQPITLAANTVLVPGFVSLTDIEQRRARLLEVLKVATVIGVLLFNSIAVVLAPMVSLLWSGKWDATIPAALGFLFLAPVQALHPIAWAITRGTGRWNLYFTAILTNGVAVVVAAAVGARSGSLTTLVASVVITYSVVTLVTLGRLARALEAPVGRVLLIAVSPWLAGIPGLVVANSLNPLNDPTLGPSIVAAGAYAAVTLIWVVFPNRKLLQGLLATTLRKR